MTDLGAERKSIADNLHVRSAFNARAEIDRRVEFIEAALARADRDHLVLGISGGVDSLTAGRLAQLAVERLRARGRSARFLAMRLPYAQQGDEDDAEAALRFIRPDDTLRVDIRPAADALMTALQCTPLDIGAAHADFVAGNVKARQRMIAQYAVANAVGGLVIGTDHAAEAVMGFFTKHGDGACDLAPLFGLTKRRVRALAAALGAPEALVQKTPTADLESLRPMKPDEEAFGLTYQVIDDFLEGCPIRAEDASRIIAAYEATAHKRAGPLVPT